jgi:ferredoxin
MTLGLEMSPSAAEADRATGLPLPDDIFVLEARGWSSAGVACEPKIVALASLANLAPPEPVASVSYKSSGNLLVIAGANAGRARRAAEQLADGLHVTLLQATSAPTAGVATWTGHIESLGGHLGEFTATIAGLARPGEPAAARPTAARFDLVLDFSAAPLFTMRFPPQGYWHAPEAEEELAAVLVELREGVGEFDKPRFFAYRENICAHSRSQVVGCDKCIEVCATGAITPDGDRIKVDPHLCMGCGTCSTVCPSGAISYQYPRVADRGTQLKQLLSTYRHAGGRDACIVFHNGVGGRDLLAQAAACGAGLPARALPLETWHVAAVGLDLLLPAIAFGASQVAVLATDSDDCERRVLREQMAIGEAILAGLGRPGRHFALIEATDAAGVASEFGALDPAPESAAPASFMLSGDKRTSIEFAVEHLAALAPAPVAEIALPQGAPYGEVRVDAKKCTLCMACVGACPESALMDGVDQPLLKFLERNCVQCGLCEATCPEDAITLSPRLLLGAAAREARVINQSQPFHCVRCDKPFATRQVIELMLGRLAGHSMFTQPGALRRLQMCADCRVIDMMSSKDEASVLGRGGGA